MSPAVKLTATHPVKKLHTGKELNQILLFVICFASLQDNYYQYSVNKFNYLAFPKLNDN